MTYKEMILITQEITDQIKLINEQISAAKHNDQSVARLYQQREELFNKLFTIKEGDDASSAV